MKDTTDDISIAANLARSDPTGKQEERQMNKHIPWQMEWKHPQWILSPPLSDETEEKNRNENDDTKIIGITSARLSETEISQMLSIVDSKTGSENTGLYSSSKSSSIRKDRHYLLTVTLLGRASDKEEFTNDKNRTTVSEIQKWHGSLASEVLLEVLDVPSSNTGSVSGASSETATTTIRTKRLRWPESIYDNAVTKGSQKGSAVTKTSRRRKRKNVLQSVLLPLMGISEEDEYLGEEEKSSAFESDERKRANTKALKQPTIGIVSATLCRRPGENMLARTKMSSTKDVLELMSFGTSAFGDGISISSNKSSEFGGYSESAFSSSDVTNGTDSQLRGAEPSNDYSSKIVDASESEDSQLEQIQLEDGESKDYGELSFVCVSEVGEVFVYDPIKLLLGNDGQSKRNLDDASTFFFGQALFQNLEETWKPLADPSARIHLSLFEHDRDKEHAKANFKNTLKNNIETNKELSNLASVSSKENKSLGSSESNSKVMRNDIHQKRLGNRSRSSNSEGSVSAYLEKETGDSSTIATSATDTLTVVQTMALELQTGVDEAISTLPYLLNPLLEPSTLEDRTVQNNPLNITAAGNTYLVISGAGIRRKFLQKIRAQSGPTRDKTLDSASTASPAISSNIGASSPPGSPEKTIQDSTKISDPNVDQDDKDTTFVEETSKLESVEETPSGLSAEKDAWWQHDKPSDQDGDTDGKVEDNNIAEKTDNEEWWVNEGGTEQDDDDSGKISVNSRTDSPMEDDEENSQRHYFDGYVDDYEGDDGPEYGGFVTFVSTQSWSETRTLFLPFVPVRMSHISQWNEMELLWVIGESETLLIRMDSTGPVPVSIRDIMFGREFSSQTSGVFQNVTASNRTAVTDNIGGGNELLPLSVRKFQILPVDLGATGSISPRLLCSSNAGIDPPCILELRIDPDTKASESRAPVDGDTPNNQYLHQHTHYRHASVLLKTLGHCTPQGTVVLRHAPSHVAKIMVDHHATMASIDSSEHEKSSFEDSYLWAEQGQGWSLVGSKRHIHFICWEGSTLLQGAYVQKLNSIPDSMKNYHCHTTCILPLTATQDFSLESSSHYHSNSLGNAGASLTNNSDQRYQFLDKTQLFSPAMDNLPSIDQFESFFSQNVSSDGQFGADNRSPQGIFGTISDFSKNTTLSGRQKSEYLLQKCASWSQLEDTLSDRIILERQAPVLCLRSGNTASPHIMLSLRQLVVDNGKASPFQQVLAWLVKRKNFFVAAGIGLDLLQDADSLYHLWKNAEMIDEEDEETKLFGLLDGIIPVRLLDENRRAHGTNLNLTATHLSEMTVGCFIKGGATMAETLVRFLERNKLYNPTRVALMLSLITSNLLSKNPMRNQISNQFNWKFPEDETIFDELLWPIKCLLRVGTERGYLNEILTLLNNTVPDELRNRYPEDTKEEQNTASFNLTLTKKAIRLILESDPVALDILMSFIDDQSQENFWQSLDHRTKLALFLMNIDSSFPFLRHPDSRLWARGELDSCFREKSNLPTIWLQDLSVACLRNASCDLDDLRITECEDRLLKSQQSESSDTTSVTGTNVPSQVLTDFEESPSELKDNPMRKMQVEIERTRNALLPSTELWHGIDYDLLLPTLLLLENRHAHWLPPSLSPSSKNSSSSEESFVSTQTLLDAVCYLAGRTPSLSGSSTSARTSVVPRDQRDDDPILFVEFDGKSAMMQCYQANNVVAGAYLVGGKNGFILHVCDVLNRGIGIPIPDAESFLLDDRLNLKIIEESKTETTSFQLTDGHTKLLLLLDETVLRIQTFGDFDHVRNRGQVDPVFAARSILRAWLSLSLDDKAAASNWLGDWLKDRLEIRRVSSASCPSDTTNSETPRSKSSTAQTSDTEDNSKNSARYRAKDPKPSRYGLACASLVRSLLWPNNKPTPKDAFYGHQIPSSLDSIPLAATMKFEKKLIIELCQSCLGLVESAPPAVVREIQI